MSDRSKQAHAWVVFEVRTNLFAAFFFDEKLAMRFTQRAKQPMRIELWQFSHNIYESRGNK